MLGGPIGARALPLSTGLADRFSLSDEIDALGDGDAEGSPLRRAVRARLGPGDAPYKSSPKGEGDSENFVDRDMVNVLQYCCASNR